MCPEEGTVHKLGIEEKFEKARKAGQRRKCTGTDRERRSEPSDSQMLLFNARRVI